MNPRHSPRPMPKAVFVSTVCGKAKKAELFCKERLWVYNYVMKTTKIIQKDYSLSSMNYQLKLPFELEVLIPDDDPVHLLSAFVEELERVKRLYVSKTMKEKRRKDLERITSGYGTQLKMNRNIQAEDLDKYAQKVRRQLRSLDRYCDGTFYLVLFISDTLLCDVRLQ